MERLDFRLRKASLVDHDAAKAKTEAMLKDLWRRKLPMVREHLHILTLASELINSATLTSPLRSEAAISAHKLAGSLGMFGYPEGTRLAREMEHLLDAEGTPPPDTFASLLRQLQQALPV